MTTTYEPCARCAAPLVSDKSRTTGLCAGCTAELEAAPLSAESITHTDACPGGGIKRHELVRRAVLVCTGCSQLVYVPRRNAWRDATPAEDTPSAPGRPTPGDGPSERGGPR